MPYATADNALARCLGPVASGSLAVTAGRGARFGAAGPTADAPLALGVWRSASPQPIDSLTPDGTEQLVGAVLVPAVSGDSLSVSGAVPGYALPTVQAGDWIADAPLAVHLRTLWVAMADRPTSAAVGGLIAAAVAGLVDADDLDDALAPYATTSSLTSTLASYATTASLASYVTTSSLTSTLASYATTASLTGKQDVLTNGSVALARLANAGGASVVGAGAAGAHADLTLGPTLAIASGQIRALRSNTYGWGLPTSAAGASGDADRPVYAPYDCVVASMRIWATANPTGTATGNVKAGATGLASTAPSLAPAALGPVSASGGWTAGTIPAGTPLLGTFGTVPADSRGLTIELTIREAP
ncbi:MAG: hypothetical protein BGO49_11165 [Planctomycetales bacterium 71-10]|nr:MAG: hypothetical protein BGO49_11165 [Planctomycetales bacterium 71-10]